MNVPPFDPSRPDVPDVAGVDAVPEEGYLAALASLTGMGPRRLGRLLRHHSITDAWEIVLGHRRPAGHLEEAIPANVWTTWAAEAAERSPADAWAACRDHGIEARAHGEHGFPDPLLHDPEPPAVVFTKGSTTALSHRRVGVIGTRNPTRSGLDTAHELGRQLAAAGVVVVSGLARGIDAAAHRGALDAAGAPPVGVVGNGLDRPYPRANTALWHAVAAAGLLISEWPPGTAPDAFRFPLRNRILAALCELLVVVESRERGGSLSTVRAAADRSVTVMAVPGSTRVRASAGTNQLLSDGVAPVTCTDDVLVALGLDTRRSADPGHDPRRAPDARGRAVLELCRAQPRTLAQIVEELDLDIGAAALAVARLERDGWVADLGGWLEVVGPWAGSDRRQGSSPEPA